MYVLERYIYIIFFLVDVFCGIVWEIMEKNMVRIKGIFIKYDSIKVKL